MSYSYSPTHSSGPSIAKYHANRYTYITSEIPNFDSITYSLDTQIFYLIEGQLKFSALHHQQVVEANQVIIIPRYLEFSLDYFENTCFKALSVQVGDFSPTFIQDNQFKKVVTLNDTYSFNTYLIGHTVQQIINELLQQLPTKEEKLQLLINILIKDLSNISELSEDDLVKPLSKAIQNCQTYLKHHFTDDLSLSSIAEKFKLSDYYLSRQFKEEVGLSISEYVTQQRLIYAKKLLVTHNIPVKDIAKQAGFNNVSHFCSTFKKITQQTPTEYRQRQNNTCIKR